MTNTTAVNSNGTNFLEDLSTPYRILLTAFLFLIAIVSILTNGLVILAIVTLKRLRNITSVFLINLAIGDLLTGIVAVPISLSIVLKQYKFSKNACIVVFLLTNLPELSSLLWLACISFDRYHAVIHCFEHSSQSNYRYALKLIIWTWGQAFLITIIPFFGWGDVEMVDWRLGCDVVWARTKSYTIVYFTSCYILPLFLMVYCYIRIIVIARNHARRIGDINTRILVTAPTNNDSKVDVENLSSISGISHSYQNIKGKSSTTVRLVGLLFAFLLLWTPSFYSKLDEGLSNNEISKIAMVIGCVSRMITLLSAGVNPLIYALGSRKFRRTLRQKFRKKKPTKRGKSNMNLSIIYTEQLEKKGELMKRERLDLDKRLPKHIIESQELQIDSLKDKTVGSLTSTSGKRSGTTETAL